MTRVGGGRYLFVDKRGNYHIVAHSQGSVNLCQGTNTQGWKPGMDAVRWPAFWQCSSAKPQITDTYLSTSTIHQVWSKVGLVGRWCLTR